MSEPRDQDWDPTLLGEPLDQTSFYDATRRRCPVAFSELFGWSVFRHQDVMQVLNDPASFSSRVSQHVAVPNGTDPPEHTLYRRIIEPYFSAGRMARLEPDCRRVAIGLIDGLGEGTTEIMSVLAEPFAVQAQCAFLQWPAQFHEPLREWVRKNHAAVRSRDRNAMAAVAFEFDGHIRAILAAHREGRADIAGPVVGELLGETVGERPIDDAEVISILRNWTVGELATISASVGIVSRFIAERETLQTRLRANPALLGAAIDEILRIQAPLMTSRRITAAPAEVGGRPIPSDERITIMWASANRDERVFDQPEEFSLERDPANNLLYGAGIHVCPGAPLARLELRVMFEELLARVRLAPVPGDAPRHAIYPAAGFSSCSLDVCRLDGGNAAR